MLHILGMILKIAGVLLGSILGIILLISLLILFVPIRYRVEASYREKPEADALVTWFLSAFRLRVRYGEAGIAIKIRIFGIPLGRRKKPGGKEKGEEEQKAEPAKEPENRTEEAKEKPQEEPEEEDKSSLEVLEAPEEPEGKKKPSKRFSLMDKLRGIREKIKYTFQNICDKIKAIRKKTKELLAFIKDEKNKEAFRLIVKQLKYLWKHMKPKKLSISCRFGFDDPSLTGQALAAASVFYPFYRGHISLMPDFEQKVLSGEVFIKGRIRIFPMVLITIRLWRNRQIRGMVRKFIK